MKEPYSHDQLMATATVRYCLGRRSYIVSDCVEWLMEVWPQLEPNTKFVILRDVEEAFARNAVGDDMDRRQWERVRAMAGVPPAC